MDVLDENGRLFGAVNVIDALVVLLAVALVVGGAVVVLTGVLNEGAASDSQDPAPLGYATVTYTEPLDSPAAGLSPGGNVTASGDTYNITDVHRSVAPTGQAHVAARLVYRGEFAPGGSQALVGDSLEAATGDSRVDVTVRALGQEVGLLETNRVDILVAVNASHPGAAAVEPGDEVRIAGDSVGTIEAVDMDAEDRTLVGATVTARETVVGPAFGGNPLRIGNRIGVVTDRAALSGRLVALETADPADVR